MRAGWRSSTRFRCPAVRSRSRGGRRAWACFCSACVTAGIAYLVYGATAARGLVTGVPLVVLVVGYIVYAVLPMVDELSGSQRFSPLVLDAR